MTRTSIHFLSRVALLFPDDVERGLERVRAAGLVPDVPNIWQVTLGVVRMWHRVAFRSETVGTSTRFPVRPTLRARLLHLRPIRFPFLLRERAVAPLDFSGLMSSRERIIRHLLGAHHDGNQFVYDLSLLACHDRGEKNEALRELLLRARAVVSGEDPRAEWLRDLVVFERYHEELVRAAEAALAGRLRIEEPDASNPDITFEAYLGWCARQPATPEATWAAKRSGRWTPTQGWLGSAQVAS